MSGYWILLFFIADSLGEGLLNSIMVVGFLFSWPGMPIAIYKDSELAPQYTAKWHPNRGAYIIGSLIPVGGLIAGPLYLARRWWYANNKELDNAEDLRSSFEAMIEDISNQVENAKEESTNASDTPRKTNAVRVERSKDETPINSSRDNGSLQTIADEYEKHALFIESISETSGFVDGDRIAAYCETVCEMAGSGDISIDEYISTRQELQTSVQNGKKMSKKLREIPPSSEFESTARLYELYLDRLDGLLLGLEELIDSVEGGHTDPEMLSEITDDLQAIEDLSSKLSRSVEDDIKNIELFAQSVEQRLS